MRSDELKTGPARAPHRALLRALGIGARDQGRPVIGIANSFNELIPGHMHLRSIAEQVKYGVYQAGGVPLEFDVIGVCDGLAMNHEGMNYSLVSREVIADSVEIMARAHALDGLVLIPNCDKVVPGMVMAAARLDLPVARRLRRADAGGIPPRPKDREQGRPRGSGRLFPRTHERRRPR